MGGNGMETRNCRHPPICWTVNIKQTVGHRQLNAERSGNAWASRCPEANPNGWTMTMTMTMVSIDLLIRIGYIVVVYVRMTMTNINIFWTTVHPSNVNQTFINNRGQDLIVKTKDGHYCPYFGYFLLNFLRENYF